MDPYTTKAIMKGERKLEKWEEKQQYKQMKAESDASLKHFKDIKHSPDVFEEG